MFAVIETGGKQYKVQNGDVIYVEKLAQEENSEVKFQVVALGGENGLKIGTPYVEGASVTGKVLKNGVVMKTSLIIEPPRRDFFGVRKTVDRGLIRHEQNHSVHLQTEKRF